MDSTFSAPCSEHAWLLTFLSPTFTKRRVPRLAAPAAVSVASSHSWPGIDAALHASEELWKANCNPSPRVQKEFHFTEAEVGQLKMFKTLPGIYTKAQSVGTSRVEAASVYQAGVAAGSTPEVFVQVTMWGFRPQFNFAGACALPYYDRPTDAVEDGVSCAGCYLAFHKFSMVSQRWAAAARDMVYARDSFLDHFRWCKQAQILWTSSEDGTREPPELPKIARDGGLFKSRE